MYTKLEKATEVIAETETETETELNSESNGPDPTIHHDDDDVFDGLWYHTWRDFMTH